jgi:hypothetical protein
MLFPAAISATGFIWMYHCPESISAAYITSDGAIQEIHHLEQNDTNSVFAATRRTSGSCWRPRKAGSLGTTSPPERSSYDWKKVRSRTHF